MTPAERSRHVLRALRDGDHQRVLDLAEPMVRRIAAEYYLPGGDRHDVLQEARCGVFAAIDAWSPGGAPFLPFAELVARRRITTALRSALRYRHQVLTAAVRTGGPPANRDGERTLEFADLDADPAIRLERSRDLAVILDSIARDLSTTERDALVGVAFRGDTYVTLAAAGGVTTKSIDNAVQRARAKLRAAVALATTGTP